MLDTQQLQERACGSPGSRWGEKSQKTNISLTAAQGALNKEAPAYAEAC